MGDWKEKNKKKEIGKHGSVNPFAFKGHGKLIKKKDKVRGRVRRREDKTTNGKEGREEDREKEWIISMYGARSTPVVGPC